MISLTDLSNKLDISKPALMARIRKISDFRGKYCELKNHRLFISFKGARLISYGKHDSTSDTFHTRRGSYSRITKTELISDNHKLIKSNFLLINRVRHLVKQNHLLQSKYIGASKKLLRLPNSRHMNFVSRLKFLFGKR